MLKQFYKILAGEQFAHTEKRAFLTSSRINAFVSYPFLINLANVPSIYPSKYFFNL